MMPLLFVAVFLGASFVMIWRLEAMAKDGMEGTVLGTLIMPYCTGMGNLIFAWLMGAKGGSGDDVLVNCLVNNVTNLTLLVGLPIAVWGMRRGPEMDRRAVLITLGAALVFTGAAWVLMAAGAVGFSGGAIMVALFVAWQGRHVVAAARSKAGRGARYAALLAVDFAILLAGSYALYLSTDWLAGWVSNIHMGFISARHLGWLSGWLDVLPNAALAFYYGWKRRPEVVYASQIGDGHICIPLCLGIFALQRPGALRPCFQAGVIILVAAILVHLLFMGFGGRLPRLAAWALVAAYGLFLWAGLPK